MARTRIRSTEHGMNIPLTQRVGETRKIRHKFEMTKRTNFGTY